MFYLMFVEKPQRRRKRGTTRDSEVHILPIDTLDENHAGNAARGFLRQGFRRRIGFGIVSHETVYKMARGELEANSSSE